MARVYLQGGHVAAAARHFAAAAADPTADPQQVAMDTALLAAAEGDWARAEGALRGLLAAESGEEDENYVAVNNLAVVLLNQGRLQEVRRFF